MTSSSMGLVALIALMTAPGPAAAAATTTTAMGSAAGSFSVNQGSASYTVQLTVPPGTAGMAPNLSVVYSSGGRNGVLGVGFALQGVSGITRCAAQIVSDGFKGGVSYDANDRFCLNGQRLVQVGTQNGNPEYRTQKESWKRIVAAGTCGSGPCSFTLQEKDGTVSTFGARGGSAVLAQGSRFTGSLAGSVRAWLMDTVTDLNGNSMSLAYTQTPSQAGGGTLSAAGSGQVYLDSITYTYQGGPPASRAVRFYYRQRPDPLVQFLGGGLIQTSLLLAQITTSITPAQCGGPATCPAQGVMSYGFAYASAAPTTGRSRLSSLTQCNAAGDCFPPTTFTWSSGGNSLHPVQLSTGIGSNQGWVGDFNGDGLTDILVGPEEAQLYLSTGSGFAAGQSLGFELDDYPYQIFGDFNGDGKTDIYVANSSEGYLYLGGGNPFTCANNCAPISIQQQDFLLAGDFNGDGMTDILVASAGTNSGTIYLSNGATLVKAGSFSNVSLGQGQNFVGDFNGDGRADVLSLGTSSGTLYFSSETGNTNTTLSAGVPLDPSSVVISGDQRWVGDFNGDGLADLLVGGAGTATINYGTGSGLQKGNPITGLNLSNGATWVGDFNGDGLADLYSASNTSGTLYLGTGTGFTCVANSANPSQCAAITQNLSVESSFVGDFNGDGMTDVFYANSETSAFNWAASGGAVLSSNAAADMMVAVTDGYGGQTSIVYQPLTNPSVYGESAATGSGVAGVRGLSNLYNPVPLFPSLVQGYPVEQVRGGQYVVASYTESNNASVNSAQGYSYTYGYYYQNALLNLVGRGFLGYGSITQTDPQLKAQTTTTYDQQFPYNGKPQSKAVCNQQSAATCAAGAAGLEETDLTWNCLDSQSQTACTINNQTYQSDATQVFFVSPQSSTRQDLKLGSQVTETFAFDGWGNPQLISAPGDANSPSTPLYTCTSYFPANSSQWLFGFVQYTKQTANSSCLTNIGAWQANDLTLQQYAYDAHWNQTTSLGWDDRNAIWFGDYQTFGPQGLPVTTADMSGSPAAVIAGTTATTTYDAGFQTFPASYATPAPAASGDTQPLTIHYAYDARFGTAVAQQDPNGNVVNTCVDGFGRTVQTQGPIQGGASASANCVDAATYPYAAALFTGNANLVTTGTTEYSIDASSATLGTVSQTLNAWTGNAWTAVRTQVDGLGRTVASSAMNDQSQTIVTRTQYLDAKHVLQGSLPTLSTATPLWKVFGYDALGRPASLTSPFTDVNGTTSQVSTTWTYGSPNVVTTVEAAGTSLAETVTSTLRYSGSKARVFSLARNGGTTTFAYDGLGRVTSATTPAPAASPAVIEGLAYDGLGRVVQRSDSNSGTRNYTYDPHGDLWQETDAKNQTITYAWDSLHRATSQTQSAGGGQVQSVIRMTYDVPSGSGGTNVAGQRSTAAVYDAGQQLLDGYQYGYDAYGRSTRQDITLGGTTFELATSYDPQGRTLTRTFPAISGLRPVLQASYFAANGELQSIQYAADGSRFTPWASYSGYDAFGRPSGVVFGNQARETWGYNPEGRVSSQTVTDAGGGSLINAVVGWNQLSAIDTVLDCNFTGNSGNSLCAGRAGASATNQGSSYTYAGRRLATAGGPAGNLTYCYDPAGNLTLKEGVSFTYSGAQVTTGASAVTPTNCATAAGAPVYSASYDPNGNLQSQSVTSGGVTTRQGLTWSVQDFLSQLQVGGVTAEQNLYDFTGRRVAKVIYQSDGKTVDHAVLYPAPDFEVTLPNGGTAQSTLYLTDNRGRFAAMTASLPAGSALARPARQLGVTLAAGSGEPVSGQQLVFHRDLVTSTQAVTDGSGAAYAGVQYKPFGQPTVTPAANDTFRPKYGGLEYDASGFYYASSRYYSPWTGRFASADSQLASQMLVQDSFNRYAYALNDPVLYTDPSGHGPLLDALVAVALEETASAAIQISEDVVLTITDVTPELTGEELLASQEAEDFAVDTLNGLQASSAGDPMGAAGSGSAQSGGGKILGKRKTHDKRFDRPGWRKQRVLELRIETGGSATAAFSCPTCDTVMTGAKVKRGTKLFVDFDIDHIMMTHADRVGLVQFIESNPRFQGRAFTRKEFLDIYHDSLRLQCPSCNRSHKFEPSDWDETVYTWVFVGENTPQYAPF